MRNVPQHSRPIKVCDIIPMRDKTWLYLILRVLPQSMSCFLPYAVILDRALTHWGWDKMDAISQTTFSSAFSWNENVWIPIKISLKFVPEGPMNNIPALVQIMAWRRPGDKPLSEPMMVSLTTHICVTRPQWVNDTRRSQHNSITAFGGMIKFTHYQDAIWFYIRHFVRPIHCTGNITFAVKSWYPLCVAGLSG